MGDGTLRALVARAPAVSAARRQHWLDAVNAEGTSGLLVVTTCQRVEVHGARHTIETVPSMEGLERLDGDAAARHLIALAVGLDSVVVGEDQVLHQLREAALDARRRSPLPPELDRLLDVALHAGRIARSWRRGPGRSLADVAVERIVDGRPVHGVLIAVVGTGAMGRLAAVAAQRRGARVVVAGRRLEAAQALAARLGVEAEEVGLGRSADHVAGAVVAVRGAWTPPDRTLDAMRSVGARVVDLSAPPALPALARARLGPLHTSIDDLAAARDEVAATEMNRLDRLVERSLGDYRAWLGTRKARDAAAALASRATSERAAELDSLWRRLPELDPAARAEIERMTEHLAERLLREPLTRLGRDVDGRHERAARELFGL